MDYAVCRASSWPHQNILSSSYFLLESEPFIWNISKFDFSSIMVFIKRWMRLYRQCKLYQHLFLMMEKICLVHLIFVDTSNFSNYETRQHISKEYKLWRESLVYRPQFAFFLDKQINRQTFDTFCSWRNA